jgi:2-succinyl-6-hydroxy-2,4-cyclohexadiene-1-carboxylate synthase
MAEAVSELVALLDREGLGQIDVLGYSLGGRTALALLAAAPGRIRRAVVVGAGAGIADESQRAARRASDAALADRIEQIGVPAFLAEWQAQPLIRTQQAVAPALRALMDAARQHHTAAGLAASLRGMGQGTAPALHEALRGITVPVLCVAGEHDLRYRAAAAELAQLLPAGRIVVVPAAGHAAHLEAPAAFVEHARPFLYDETLPRS